MLEVAPENTVAQLTHVFARASTFPCRAKTQAGTEWVVKFRGAGPGPVGLLTEFVALRAARAMGLEVPEARPLYLPPGFPWTVGTDEFDGIVQRSFGWNLGVAYVADSRPASRDEVLGGDRGFLERLAQVDRAFANTDRGDRNTNVLVTPAGLIPIDFDACLFLRRAARGETPRYFPLWPDHVLRHAAGMTASTPFDPHALIAAIDEVPVEWIEAARLDRTALRSGLTGYCAAWNLFSSAAA